MQPLFLNDGLAVASLCGEGTRIGIPRGMVMVTCSKSRAPWLAFPDPGEADAHDAMLGAAGSGHRSGDIAVMLEEIEITPGHFFKIVSLAKLAALGAGILGASVSANVEMEFTGFFERIQLLFH